MTKKLLFGDRWGQAALLSLSFLNKLKHWEMFDRTESFWHEIEDTYVADMWPTLPYVWYKDIAQLSSTWKMAFENRRTDIKQNYLKASSLLAYACSFSFFFKPPAFLHSQMFPQSFTLSFLRAVLQKNKKSLSQNGGLCYRVQISELNVWLSHTRLKLRQ